MTIYIAPLGPGDRARWDCLAHGYKLFYETHLPDSEYENAWQRLMAHDGIFGIGAYQAGLLVGITHYLFHTNVWAQNVCYLQDLFVDPQARGIGVAGTLIEAVANVSRERGAARLYWLTQEHNATGRRLYDKIAKFQGFIRYDYPLG